jgi:membrane protease subunit HflC
MKNLTNILVTALVALLFLMTSAYTVDQAQFVVVKRLGEIVSVKKSPGLYFKVPFIDDIKRFDNRIVTLDWEQPAKFITSENKYMLVDSFVKWRIIDPAKYYVSVKEGGETAAEDRLSSQPIALRRFSRI